MSDIEFFTGLLDLAGQIVLSGVLLWLLINERQQHTQTRHMWHDDVKRANEQFVELLKELAGIKASMSYVQQVQRTWQEDSTRRGDTRPLPYVEDPNHPAAGD